MSQAIQNVNLKEGDVVKLLSGEDFCMSCCDCLLAHRINVEIDGNLVKLKITRDEEMTVANRKNNLSRLVRAL